MRRSRADLLRLLLLGTLLILGACRSTGPDQTDVRLQGRLFSGPLDGFVQIPAGGNPGSTSNKRPELDEIGIHRGDAFDLLGSREKNGTLVYLGYRSLDESGDKVLASDLTTNNATFDAGTEVSSSIGLSWWRIGAGHRFRVGPRGTSSLIPLVEVTLLKFSYTLRADPAVNPERAGRGFKHGGVRFGLQAEHELPNGARLFASALVPIPANFSTEANITSLEAGAIVPLSFLERFSSSLFFGVSLDNVRFEDDQEVPNRIEVDFGPAVFVGFEARL